MGNELFWLTFPNTLFPITPDFGGPIPPPNTFFATFEFTPDIPTLFSLDVSPVAPGFSVGRADPLDDLVANTVFVSGCLPLTDESAVVEGPEVTVTDPVLFRPLPVPTRPTELATPFPFSLPLTLPSLLVLSITIVVVLDVEGLKPMLVFGRDGIGAFNRSKAFDRLIKLAGLWYPADDDGRIGLDVFWLDTEDSIEVDEVVEVMELLDMVRAIVRDEPLGCVDVEGSGAGVREAGPTDLLLILFFEVDTGIMEVEAPGSRGFPGVWNPCPIDFGLVGEEGLDFACELAVGKAKPIDFRGFGVTGVDKDAEKLKPWYQFGIRGPM